MKVVLKSLCFVLVYIDCCQGTAESEGFFFFLLHMTSYNSFYVFFIFWVLNSILL